MVLAFLPGRVDIRSLVRLLSKAGCSSDKGLVRKDGPVLNNEMSSPTRLTTGGVARIFEVHPGTIRRWCEEGRIRGYRSAPRSCRRFLREDVAER